MSPALASLDGTKLCVLVWHYHDDDLSGPDAAVELSLSGFPNGKARLEHFRVDAEHSNAFVAWKRMGSPERPVPDQYATLEKAGQLTALSPPQEIEIKDAAASIRFTQPRQAVSLLVINR